MNMSGVPFEVGATYHRVEDIHDKFGGNRYSGISPSSDYPYVFIFYGKSGEWHGYEDELKDDGRFLYTGEGRDGDMTMDGGNAAIRNHATEGNELHVFEINEGAWQVTYVGEYEYSDHWWTRLPDRNDVMREAIRFELVPAGGLTMAVESDVERMSEDELYELAENAVAGESENGTSTTTRKRMQRSEAVREYALHVADGICQGCEEEAPFIGKDGEPFLEVHHLYRRGDGGADHPDNVVAICPNCHRRVHYGEDGEEFNQYLIEKRGGNEVN